MIIATKTARYSTLHCIGSVKEAAILILSSTPDLQEKAILTKLLSKIFIAAIHQARDQAMQEEILIGGSGASYPPASPYRHPVAVEEAQSIDVCSRREVVVNVKMPDEEFAEHRVIKLSSVEFTIHGIANAEAYAIDLFWDIMARYSHCRLSASFYLDMLYIVDQEADHFLSWFGRLIELRFPFGSLPSYHGLWDSASDTAHDLQARLAVINLTHEAKGLDSYSKTR